MITKILKAFYHYILISRSGLFDRLYYLETYPDLLKIDVDPLWHYFNFWLERR